jgi:hypothetical protein
VFSWPSHWPGSALKKKGPTGENLGRPRKIKAAALSHSPGIPTACPACGRSRPALDQSVSTVPRFLPSLSTGKEEITSAHIARSSGSAALTIFAISRSRSGTLRWRGSCTTRRHPTNTLPKVGLPYSLMCANFGAEGSKECRRGLPVSPVPRPDQGPQPGQHRRAPGAEREFLEQTVRGAPGRSGVCLDLSVGKRPPSSPTKPRYIPNLRSVRCRRVPVEPSSDITSKRCRISTKNDPVFTACPSLARRSDQI